MKGQSRVGVWVAAAGIALAVQTAMAIDVKVDFDKAFDFKVARTWGWNPEGPGKIMMARTAEDDPEAMKKLAEPVIVNAVTTEIGRRGLQSTTSTPDLFATYFLLLTNTSSAQTMGQFLPPTVMWGVPPFAAATQSLEFMNAGALILDFSVKQTVVWRGVAQAKIKIGTDIKQREALIREAVRDILRRFPPKS